MEKLKNLKKKMEEVKQEMRAIGKEALLEAFQELFQKHPVLVAVQWHQYTPYFNDGEPCEFGVNEPDIQFQGDDEPQYISYDRKKYTPEQCKALDDVDELFKACDDELMLQVFNDHVEVVATRDGFDVREYNHD